ncbi:MAG: protein phosphatase 2C domain-containing protein [Syntrophorhabdaceae bacterium]|nr:protein phosphatase 2C domain-containing protein [Syntrophorhabdaceae bacterium]
MMNMLVSFAARSHVGHVRGNNEDNLYCDGAIISPEARETPFSLRGETGVPCVFAVCDGMGGEEDGALASFLAVSALREHAEEIARAASLGETDAAVREFVYHANSALCDKMSEKGRFYRMGTTLAMIVVTGDAVRSYNIGDSRVYTLREGRLSRVSEDHTAAAQKVRMGLITEEQARLDHDRHRLTRHLGIFEDEMSVEATVSDPLPLGIDDVNCRVLLCSDGVTDMVEDERIEEILNAAPDAWEAVNVLVDEALDNGGRDNVTCVVVDINDVRRAL